MFLNHFPRLFWIALVAGGLAISCAEQPDGTFVMNEETIENFFERDGPKKSANPPSQLNLQIDQPVVLAELPAPGAGISRISGILSSAGVYPASNAGQAPARRGAAFKNSKFGMLGDAGDNGNAWFYADYNPLTGEIIDARAYIYGFMGGVCDLRQKNFGSYGQIGKKDFTIVIDGPCLFPAVSGSTSDFSLFIQGEFETNGSHARLRYIINDTGSFTTIPEHPETDSAIFDFGNGSANIR